MIVCLGWGSLIWDPRELQAKSEWHTDGPQLPIEFSRQSKDGRITLVIDSSAPKVQVLWSQMTASSLKSAIRSLAEREGAGVKSIGSWTSTEDPPERILGLDEWADSVGASSVIWTALPSKFNGRNNVAPSLKQLINYFQELDEATLIEAKRYVCKAHAQIQTPYRKALVKEFGW